MRSSTSSYAICEAAEKDAALIGTLARRIWPKVFGFFLTPEQIENILAHQYTPEAILQQMADGHRFWIGHDGDAPAAYASSYKEGDAIWLKKLYCSPAAQGKGLATALMDAATKAFLPARELRLLVNHRNLPARRFYERRGFIMLKEVPVMMGDFAFTDCLYAKSLTEANHVSYQHA